MYSRKDAETQRKTGEDEISVFLKNLGVLASLREVISLFPSAVAAPQGASVASRETADWDVIKR